EIYSNPLFDEEIIPIKIDPHHFNDESNLIEPLLNQKSLIISSSKIDSLLDEFASELILLKSIPPGIDEANCDPEEEICLIKKLLYDNSSPRPPEEIDSKNSNAIIESFSTSPIPVVDSDPFMEEIDLFLTSDGSISPANCDPEEEICLIKKLLYDNSSPRPPEEIDSKNSNAIIESFSTSPIPVVDSDPFMEEIDLFLTSDGSISPGIDSDYSDSERDNRFP
nr:hypothetical protein [Tanacetum cinerariifolium]